LYSSTIHTGEDHFNAGFFPASRDRIREPEAALPDAHMDYCLESAFLDIACERPGTSAEALKKTYLRLPGRLCRKALPSVLLGRLKPASRRRRFAGPAGPSMIHAGIDLYKENLL
jgi:hypothetical protein